MYDLEDWRWLAKRCVGKVALFAYINKCNHVIRTVGVRTLIAETV